MRFTDYFLSLVIPVYNEQDRLEAPLPEVFEYCRRFAQSEVIFSDDGSTDRTNEKLRDIAAQFPSVRIVRSERNYGKGHAVKIGLAAARGELLLFSDADFSAPISEAEKLFRALAEGNDIAIGSRGIPGSTIVTHQPRHREAAGKIGNLLVRAILPIQVRDSQCGFKMMHRKAAGEILPRMTINGFAFDIEMLIIAGQHGLQIAEVPVIWKNVEGSKVQAIHNFQVLSDLLRIRYRMALGIYS